MFTNIPYFIKIKVGDTFIMEKDNKKEFILKRLFNFIDKDIKAENESKKIIVIIRWQFIALFAMFGVNAIAVGLSGNTRHLFVCALFWISLIGVFALTYITKTIVAEWIFNIFIIIWLQMGLMYYGWKSGVQNYLFLLILLYFFASYGKNVRKWLFAFIALAYRIVLYYVYFNAVPLMSLPDKTINVIQIATTTSIFIGIALTAYTFSSGVGELEGKLVKYNDSLKIQANTDQLTGLFNRRRAIEYLNELIHNTQEGTFSLCIGDVDFFKKVNDVYGHDAGDEVLKAISHKMEEGLRKETFIARWGGEEFLIVFPGVNGDEAWSGLERLRKNIEKSPIKIANGQEISITMTFGLTEYDFGSDIDTSIKDADEKLYQGKESGRNKVVY